MNETEFGKRLLTWFEHHGRKHLLWQYDISPYRVWVSEIMLQQTQVATVVPYFEKFMARFPSVDALAGASQDEVLHYWTGLGYYARARNMHKTAIILSETRQGAFPPSVFELSALPGIGRSTAGAIVSIAMAGRAAILDGNVKRVLARCFGIAGWPSQSGVAAVLWEKAEQLTPSKRVADYTQAIMDLGATVCTRASPTCGTCPFENDCVARRDARIDELPGKKPKKTMPVRTTCMLIIENNAQELLLELRPNNGLWGGLWSFPECPLDQLAETLADLPHTQCEHELPPFRHTFTHFHLDITPVHLKLSAHYDNMIREGKSKRWYSLAAPPSIGLTRPVTKLIEAMRE